MGTLYKEKKITFDIMDENPSEGIFDNRDNSYLALRNVSWNGQNPKLEIRRWYADEENKETPSKGISFYTEEGPHQLTHLLLKLGYGDNNIIESIMKERKSKESVDNNINRFNNKESVKDHLYEKIKDKVEIKEQNSKFSAKNLMDNITKKSDGE